jgi:hypothetical protein
MVGYYDHWHWEIQPVETEQFASWNLVVLNFETAHYAHDAFVDISLAGDSCMYRSPFFLTTCDLLWAL